MVLAERVSNWRKRLLDVLFAVITGAVFFLWIHFTTGAGIVFPVCFFLFVWFARCSDQTKRRQYLLGLAALGTVIAGQVLSPLDYLSFPHIAFNVPFISAYLYPNLPAGAVVGMVNACLYFLAAKKETIDAAVFIGPFIGTMLLPLLCHGIAYLIYQLVKERNTYRDLNVELRREIEKEYQDKEKVRESLHRLDRLNVVGEMAASIGHEVRNPLTTVRGYLQFFEGKSGFAKYQDALQLMIEELDRANAIITEFLSLAKNKRVELQMANLNVVLDTIKPMLEADAIRRGRSILFDLCSTPDILLDESEIRQMIINLVRNGFDATSEDGPVRVATYTQDNASVLVVTDCGKEIPKHILDKMGTPFFTTKENGTGLGLAVCCRIAEHHQATIHFDSSGEGTVVTVRFKVPVNIARSQYASA